MTHTLLAMTVSVGAIGAVLVGQAPSATQETAAKSAPTIALSTPPKHVIVAREPGRYGGWPANHGVWAWGNEILVGFSWGHMSGGTAAGGHPIDRKRPEEHRLARSLDGGETWQLEKPAGLTPPPTPGNIAGVPTEQGGREAVDLTTPIDFTAPGFALTARMSSIHVGPSWFFYTTDKGRTWHGPFKLPDFGQKGIAARTDYLVEGRNELTIFLTAAKSNGREGRVICARTQDGGLTWKLVGMVGSRTKIGKLLAQLADDVPAERQAALHAPAGLAIGAIDPEEIALAILGEIVRWKRAQARAERPATEVKR